MADAGDLEYEDADAGAEDLEYEDPDAEDLDFVPPHRVASGPDVNGVKKVVEYKFEDEGNKVESPRAPGSKLSEDDVEQTRRLVGDVKVYPRALQSHEEVVRNPDAFMETFRQFHASMRTNFMMPVMGGKDLDLHTLYVEVTRRGGLEKVLLEKRWREVIAVFNFPPTTTSASYVLKKNYINFLHHYEQVYFFRLEGPLIPPIDIKSPPFRFRRSRPVSESMLQRSSEGKRTITDLQTRENVNFTVTGTIDGKFEHGYLVTVNIGSEILRGVLYHALPSEASSSSATLNNAVVPYADLGGVHRRQKTRWKNRKPAHPKPNLSGYNFFFAEKHSKLKELFPNRDREYSKMIGESWKELTEAEKSVYDEYGLRDKERYKREKQEYEERLKVAQPRE